MINQKYAGLKKLGAGRNQIFTCHEKNNPQRMLAIKISPDVAANSSNDSLLNEYRVLKSLDHPGILKVYEYGKILDISEDLPGVIPGASFIVTDFIPGSPLDSVLDKLDSTSLKKLLLQLSDVLYYIHQNNYIYTDLKLENVLVDEDFNITLIDFELAKDNLTLILKDIGGTSEYTAPEIIQREIVDQRCDLYSLGMLLYRIIFNKFPFASKDKLDIYKAHVDGEFEYPATNYQIIFVDITKKLLSKKSFDRYYTSLEIISELEPEYIQKVRKHWKPCRKFAGRENYLTKLEGLLSTKKFRNIILRGPGGTGKSSLLEHLFFKNRNVMLISKNAIDPQYPIHALLQSVLYSSVLQNKIAPTDFEHYKKKLNAATSTLTEAVSFIRELIDEKQITLLVDDFETFKGISQSLVKELIFIVKINNGKVILSENSDSDYRNNELTGFGVLNLPLLNKDDIKSIISTKLASFFPREELTDIICEFGNLNYFDIDNIYNELLEHKIIQFTSNTPTLVTHQQTINELHTKFEQKFEERYFSLPKDTKLVLDKLSLFDTFLRWNQVQPLLDFSSEHLAMQLDKLQKAGMLVFISLEDTFRFPSNKLKDFVRQEVISLPNQIISQTLQIVKSNENKYDIYDVATLHILAGNSYKAAEIYFDEAEKQKKQQAYNNAIITLQKILGLNLTTSVYCKTNHYIALNYFAQSDFKNSLDYINKSIQKDSSIPDYNLHRIRCLVKLQQPNESIEAIEEFESSFPDKFIDDKSLLLANIWFDLNEIDKVESEIQKIISSNSNKLIKAQAYNLCGIISYYIKSNFDKSITSFNEAQKIYLHLGEKNLLAGVKINKGNIYHSQSKKESALNEWNEAKKIVQKTGNYDQEAKLLNSLGIYHYERNNYEEAENNYRKSLLIFKNTANMFGEGLCYTNLGELFLRKNDFEESEANLIHAERILKKLNSFEDLAEVKFYLALINLYKANPEVYLSHLADLQKLSGENDGELIEALSGYLQVLFAYGYLESIPELEEIEKHITLLFDYNQKQKAYKLRLLKCRLLLKDNKPEAALEVLKNEEFCNYAQSSPYFEAERLFLISKATANLNKKKSFSSLENAYSLIEKLDITFLTIEIVTLLAFKYRERGILEETKRFYEYSIMLFSYYTKKIKSDDNLDSFLSQYPVAQCTRILQDLENVIDES